MYFFPTHFFICFTCIRLCMLVYNRSLLAYDEELFCRVRRFRPGQSHSMGCPITHLATPLPFPDPKALSLGLSPSLPIQNLCNSYKWPLSRLNLNCSKRRKIMALWMWQIAKGRGKEEATTQL